MNFHDRQFFTQKLVPQKDNGLEIIHNPKGTHLSTFSAQKLKGHIMKQQTQINNIKLADQQ